MAWEAERTGTNRANSAKPSGTSAPARGGGRAATASLTRTPTRRHVLAAKPASACRMSHCTPCTQVAGPPLGRLLEDLQRDVGRERAQCRQKRGRRRPRQGRPGDGGAPVIPEARPQASPGDARQVPAVDGAKAVPRRQPAQQGSGEVGQVGRGETLLPEAFERTAQTDAGQQRSQAVKRAPRVRQVDREQTTWV